MTTRPRRSLLRWLPVAVAVGQRPRLWSTALRQTKRMARPGWWRSWPPIPVPPTEYLAFRSITQYGDANAAPSPHDVVVWLDWVKSADWLERRR